MINFLASLAVKTFQSVCQSTEAALPPAQPTTSHNLMSKVAWKAADLQAKSLCKG